MLTFCANIMEYNGSSGRVFRVKTHSTSLKSVQIWPTSDLGIKCPGCQSGPLIGQMKRFLDSNWPLKIGPSTWKFSLILIKLYSSFAFPFRHSVSGLWVHTMISKNGGDEISWYDNQSEDSRRLPDPIRGPATVWRTSLANNDKPRK